MSSTTQSQHTGTRTVWNGDICIKHHVYDNRVEEKLGYIPAINDLIQTHGTNITVLDYGCGSGKISRRLIREKISKVEAVDISEDMIRLAIENSPQMPITFRTINTGELPFADNTFDAAICFFVLIDVGSREEFKKIICEIYRTLKPGGTFYLLDINSITAGIPFSTFGNPAGNYQDGDPFPGYLLVPDQEPIIAIGTYWTKGTYESILKFAGFTQLQSFEYKSDDIPESQRHGLGINEKLYAPFILFKTTKPK